MLPPEIQKFEAARRDCALGQETGACSGDFLKLEREILVTERDFVKGNKKIAREIAKWADKGLTELEEGR